MRTNSKQRRVKNVEPVMRVLKGNTVTGDKFRLLIHGKRHRTWTSVFACRLTLALCQE